jgi:putative effector of murein hydrolase LrgA (UPF0299 family)
MVWGLLGLVGVAAAVVVVGGYGFGWSWTGSASSDTLWAWLHLLVVPVVLAGLPLWHTLRGDLRRIGWVAAGLTAATLVLLVVGHQLDWRWTGFAGKTLWDWLNLAALPLALTTASLWFSHRGRMHPRWRAGIAAAGALFVVLVFGGYALDWRWTGFRGNTVWDWMHLLLVPFVVPLVAVWAASRVDPPAAEFEVTRTPDPSPASPNPN